MRPRRASPSTLLARIRGHDFASLSDAELRDAWGQLGVRADAAAAEDLLPECFAIVSEAIDRRLGAWRLFDALDVRHGARSTAFHSVAAVRSDHPLSRRSGVIADAVAIVTEQRRHRRAGDIPLPAEFYGAVRQQDAGGRLRFQPTGEQLLAAIHLFRGRVVQMYAGEGKTLAIAIAAALHAVLGRRVHVVTANDYLAERDAALLEPVFRSLGISSGAVPAYMEEAERRHVYARSIVYGAMRELGFDYLRDHLKTAIGERVQRALDVVIVDEADHALIDEAFTPLIISGNPLGSTRVPVRVNGAVAEMVQLQRGKAVEMATGLDGQEPRSVESQRLAAALLLADPENPELLRTFATHPRLRRHSWFLAEEDHSGLGSGLYYTVHPGKNQVTLTQQGQDFLEQRLGPVFGGPDMTAGSSQPGSRRLLSQSAARRQARHYGLANQVSQALRAHLLLQRDADYLVDDDSVVLIDAHTGRPKPDSIYQHGLQSAVEAREGVTVQPERETLAQISVSGFVSRYRHLAGITGTAATAAGEFRRKYGLEVVAVSPVHTPRRASRPPVVYETRELKLAAVVDEVELRHRTGQPVLVGTRTVEQTGEISRLLADRGVLHRVLNAVTTHAEAAIVREAGAFGAVTVATHMAGRGTDILLEPDLDASVVRQCAAEITRLLSNGTVSVQVTCPSWEQAEILEREITGVTDLAVSRINGGSDLRVSVWESSSLSPRERSSDDIAASMDFALGLCVIGTEVHDSSRITLQLDGRSGRQGQFGLARSFLSLEDRLVNLDAEAILRLTECRQTDSEGRVFFQGTQVSRRIQALQDAADREGEAQRALMQDYAAEFDRQTGLYHRRREGLISGSNADSGLMQQLSQEVVGRVAFRLAGKHLGGDVDGDYAPRFQGLQDELLRRYGVDCAALYGSDLSLLPGEIARLLHLLLERQAEEAGVSVFPELARLLYLRVCSELWPRHIDALRDSVAVELLGARNHKSAVASHIRRCNGELSRYWDTVEEEFLSRLCTLPVATAPDTLPPPVAVSQETERLLSRYATPRDAD